MKCAYTRLYEILSDCFSGKYDFIVLKIKSDYIYNKVIKNDEKGIEYADKLCVFCDDNNLYNKDLDIHIISACGAYNSNALNLIEWALDKNEKYIKGED